jgi:hypothetical protein
MFPTNCAFVSIHPAVYFQPPTASFPFLTFPNDSFAEVSNAAMNLEQLINTQLLSDVNWLRV